MRQFRHAVLSLEVIQKFDVVFVIQFLTSKSFHFHKEKLPLHMTLKLLKQLAAPIAKWVKR